jgi:hypothetical protein
MTPTEQARRAFCDEMLAVVRREFYPKPADSKKFFRDRAFLLRAITQPAAYLHKRCAMLPASNYRRILMTVIETIKAKGNRAEIGYFPRYLLHCVQTHMEHHGERYYYAAKTFEGRSVSTRQVSDAVAGALKTLARGGQGDQTVPILAEVHRALTVRGRIQKAKRTASEMELPGLCKVGAKRPK